MRATDKKAEATEQTGQSMDRRVRATERTVEGKERNESDG